MNQGDKMEPYAIAWALGGFIAGIARRVCACAIIRGGECEPDEHEDVAKPGKSHE